MKKGEKQDVTTDLPVMAKAHAPGGLERGDGQAMEPVLSEDAAACRRCPQSAHCPYDPAECTQQLARKLMNTLEKRREQKEETVYYGYRRKSRAAVIHQNKRKRGIL